jgi:hypothetical protein
MMNVSEVLTIRFVTTFITGAIWRVCYSAALVPWLTGAQRQLPA